MEIQKQNNNSLLGLINEKIKMMFKKIIKLLPDKSRISILFLFVEQLIKKKEEKKLNIEKTINVKIIFNISIIIIYIKNNFQNSQLFCNFLN